MDLVRDLLDKKVVDRHGREMGRVDSIVLDAGGGQPRIVALEIGPAVVAQRLHPIFGRWISALEHACGVDQDRPLRIPFTDVLTIHDQIKVDRAFGETAAATVEQRLRRWVASIPGSS
jgi:sporulation protein YlmC with PRC-barrel domain